MGSRSTFPSRPSPCLRVLVSHLKLGAECVSCVRIWAGALCNRRPLLLLKFIERLFQIVQEVSLVLKTHRETDKIVSNTAL